MSLNVESYANEIVKIQLDFKEKRPTILLNFKLIRYIINKESLESVFGFRKCIFTSTLLFIFCTTVICHVGKICRDGVTALLLSL